MRIGQSTAVLALAIGLLAPGRALAEEYRIEFEGTWDGSHVVSGTLPSTAHYTTLIGATHLPGAPLWTAGGLATVGIERVAELGSTGILSDEIDALIAAGDAGEEIRVSSIFDFPSYTDSTFEITEAHPSVSLISMVAPSPDWFVGVSDVALQSGGSWYRTLTVDLHPYDAGTEEGSIFSLSNPPTSPHEPIALVGGAPFVGNPVIGHVHFTLISPFACPTTPAPGCVFANRASLSISEQAAGREKLKATFNKLESHSSPGDFGDPIGDQTGYKLCIYDDAAALVGEYTVDRGVEQTCGSRPCFRAVGGKGFKYKDNAAAADGVRRMSLLGGAAGRGKISVSAGNKQFTMPTGVSPALHGSTGATAQLLIEEGGCFEAPLTKVRKDDGVSYRAVMR